MPTINWQKSTYSGDSINCVYIAATPTGTPSTSARATPPTPS